MNRILVVDDEESFQVLYADELTEEGYEVITIGDGSKLMEVIEQKRPDLVLLDIKLGKYDGLDLLQDIRNAYYDLPVILCTAYYDFRYDLKSIAADYYVIKSSDMHNLKIKIKMAIEGCKQLLPETAFEKSMEMVKPLQDIF